MVLVIEGEKHESILNVISSEVEISKYETPKEIHFINKFVETGTNKIQRTETLRKVLL